MKNKVISKFNKIWLLGFLIIILIISFRFNFIAKKPLLQESEQEIVIEINIVLENFFTNLLEFDDDHKDLENVISNAVIINELKKGLNLNSDLIEFDTNNLNFSIEINKIEKNKLFAEVTGKISNTSEFINHPFIFIKLNDKWKIESF